MVWVRMQTTCCCIVFLACEPIEGEKQGILGRQMHLNAIPFDLAGFWLRALMWMIDDGESEDCGRAGAK